MSSVLVESPSRRKVLASLSGLLAVSVAGCASVPPSSQVIASPRAPLRPQPLMQPNDFPEDIRLHYAALPEERFPIPAVDLTKLNPRYYRAQIDYATPEKPGTVIVDTAGRYLYLVQKEGKAMRYGVGIGKAGFAWSGRAHIAYGREWPVWTPPAAMIQRQPSIAKWKDGQPPGIDNALGARALYVHQGNTDTLYRLHGTNYPETIGTAVSSGCVRLLQHDIIDLYAKVRFGAHLVVLAPSDRYAAPVESASS